MKHVHADREGGGIARYVKEVEAWMGSVGPSEHVHLHLPGAPIPEDGKPSVTIHSQDFGPEAHLLPNMHDPIVLDPRLYEMVPNAVYIEPPAEVRPVTLGGIGIWRNRHRENKDVCRSLFKVDYEHGLSDDDLEICDGFILNFVDNPTISWCSSAFKAMSLNRPVFMRNIHHFHSIPLSSSTMKFATPDELREQISDVFRLDWKRRHSWQNHIENLSNYYRERGLL